MSSFLSSFSFSLPFHNLMIMVCVCGGGVNVHEGGERSTLSSSVAPFFLWKAGSLTDPWGPRIHCLCLHRSGITGACCHARLSPWILGIRTQVPLPVQAGTLPTEPSPQPLMIRSLDVLLLKLFRSVCLLTCRVSSLRMPSSFSIFGGFFNVPLAE